MALHDALEVATPSQRLAAAAHNMRLAKIASRAKPDVGIDLRPPLPEAPPEPSPTWAERQSLVNPLPKEPWFSIERSISPPKIGEIIHAICKHFEVTKLDLLSLRRDHGVMRPRQIAYYLCKKLTRATLPEIGRRLGDRDHTSVLHGVRKIEQLVVIDAAIAGHIETLKAGLAR